MDVSALALIGYESGLPFSLSSEWSNSGTSSSLVPNISLFLVNVGRIEPWEQYIREQVALGPYDAMNRLTRRAPYGTDREALRCLFLVAVIAFGFSLSM